MQFSPSPNSRRKWWRIAAWFMSSVFCLLLLTLGGVSWWIWGWQWQGEPEYHESWSSEERAALTEFGAYLRAQAVSEADTQGLSAAISTAITTKLVTAPLISALREIAVTGYGEPSEQALAAIPASPAVLAAQSGHLEALKALAAHGANMNADVIIPLLGNAFTAPEKQVTWETRRALADALISNVIDLNQYADQVEKACNQELTRGNPGPWIWAIEHGKNVTRKELIKALSTRTLHLPLIKAILSSNPELANDCTGRATPLQVLARRIRDAEATEMPALEQVLALLLEHGANPRLRPEAGNEAERRFPLDILQEKQNFARCDMSGDNCDGSQDTALTIWQRMCQMLQQ